MFEGSSLGIPRRSVFTAPDLHFGLRDATTRWAPLMLALLALVGTLVLDSRCASAHARSVRGVRARSRAHPAPALRDTSWVISYFSNIFVPPGPYLEEGRADSGGC